MTIEEKIIEVLGKYSSRDPIRRQDLLARLRDCGYDVTDREMRNICANNIPVLSNHRGYYLAETLDEVKSFYQLLRKKAISMFLRARRVKGIYVKNHKIGNIKVEYQFDKKGQGEMFTAE